MSLFAKKSAGKSGALLLDYRLKPKLVAAQPGAPKSPNCLATLEGGDVPSAQAAVAEAERLLWRPPKPSPSLAAWPMRPVQYQADVMAAKRNRAVVPVRVKDLYDEMGKLDFVTLPALDYAAKQTGTGQPPSRIRCGR